MEEVMQELRFWSENILNERNLASTYAMRRTLYVFWWQWYWMDGPGAHVTVDGFLASCFLLDRCYESCRFRFQRDCKSALSGLYTPGCPAFISLQTKTFIPLFLPYYKFRCEGIKTVLNYLQRGCFLSAFDFLSSREDIAEKDQTFFGFAWSFDGLCF